MELLLHRNKKKHRHSFAYIFVAAAILLSIIVFIPSARAAANRIVFTVVVRPLLSVAKQARHLEETAKAVFMQKRALVERNAELEEHVAALSSAVLERDVYASELEALRALLGRSDKRPGVLGSIVFYPRDIAPDTIIIDAGTRDGVSDGMRVSAFGDVLIGKVKTAFARQSVVSLISSAGFSLNARLMRPPLAVVVEGRGGGNFSVTLPKSFAVDIGTQVYTSETAPLFIGVVEDIIQSNAGATQKLFLRLPFNIDALHEALVIMEE